MAEGGDHLPVQDGSDAYIALICTPCSDEGTSEEAIKYCPECDEYLCTTCTKYHRKMKTSRDHKLVDREEGNQESKVTTVTTKIKCQQHPDRDIEMYCGAHDMVYCLMCIATEHRTCRDVTSLKDAAVLSFQQNEIDRLQKESEFIKKLLVDMEKTKQENVVLLKEKRKQIQKRVQEIEDSLIERIKTVSKQTNVSLKETYSKVKNTLESDIAVVNRTRSEVENINGQLQTKTKSNQEQWFVKVKLCQQIINNAKNLHAQFQSDGQISVEFAESKTFAEGQFLGVKTLGKIKESVAYRKREIKRQKDVNVKMQNDQDTCWITDICQLDSGRFVLADFSNNKVKLMDTDHTVTDHFSVQGPPTGICKTGNNEVAVKLKTNNIELLSVGTRISKLRSVSIKEGSSLGMTYTTGKFWVGTSSGVDVYDLNGTFEKSVAKDAAGVKMLKGRPRQMTVFQNSVFLADFSDGIVCLKSNGTKKAEFRDSRLTSTVGVCISCYGTLYTVDDLSKKIVMFSQNGKCLGELAPGVSSWKSPESLCYHDKNSCILMGYQRSDTVTIITLSD